MTGGIRTSRTCSLDMQFRSSKHSAATMLSQYLREKPETRLARRPNLAIHRKNISKQGSETMPIAKGLSRRAAISTLGAAVATCGLAVAAKAQEYHPQEQTKLTKTASRYQDQPKSDQSCASCPYFVMPNKCVVVDGEISPNGWCPMFTTFSPLDRGAHT
jgi:hypothetical protein